MNIYRFPALTIKRQHTYFDIDKKTLDGIRSDEIFDFKNIRITTLSEDGAPFYLCFNAKQARVIREFFLLQNLAPIDGNDWWHVEKFEERNRKIREGFSNNEAFCTLGYALMDVATSDSKLVINDDKPSSIQ